jgi:hypothetical protein
MRMLLCSMLADCSGRQRVKHGPVSVMTATEVIVGAIGPFGLEYPDAANDPRNRSRTVRERRGRMAG